MLENIKTDNFEHFLVDHGFITQALYEDFKKKSTETGQSIIGLITTQKVLSPESLAQAKGAFLNIPYANFQDQKIPDKFLELIPNETIQFYKFFAFDRQDNNVKVAIVDPTNIQALEALEFFSKKRGLNIQLYVTDEISFNKIVHRQQTLNQVVSEALTAIDQKEDLKKKEVQQKNDSIIQDAPISKIVEVILTNAIENSASDIHVEPSEKELRVRYRIDGILHTTLVLPMKVAPAIISKIKILSNLKIDESRLPQDGRFHYETTNKSTDLRVSVLPNINGEKVVMRILDKTTRVPTLEELGFRGKSLAWTEENIKKTHGIFLITGPTGSGKSTTLYALLSILNKTSVNIVTLEDPVEYFIDGVNQSQINPDIGLTFSVGLRSILRQDPNIIMVGEIRDKETAELAVHAALTGHLVFSTLHTNSAIGALPRLIDMGIEPFLLVASVNAIGAQRLARKICSHCKYEIDVPDILKNEITKQLDGVKPEELAEINLKQIKLFAGKGCEKCGHSGFKGRVAIVEIFLVTPKIQYMVISKASSTDLFEEAKKTGMITMQQDGIIKALQGQITYDEIIRVTSE